MHICLYAVYIQAHTGTYVLIQVNAYVHVCVCIFVLDTYRYERGYIAPVAARLLRVCPAASVRRCCAVVQVHCVIAARSASELLRGCCTLDAQVAHVHEHENRHENQQFYSDQVRSTG